MPRSPRVEVPGGIHHVIARGNAGSRIVLDEDDRRSLVVSLGRAAERHNWRVHAYCLMDNHVHVVAETPEAALGSGMRHLLGGYARAFNRRHGRYGHLFAGRFSAWLVETEAYAIAVCAYVVLNPVRAGLVLKPEDWPWSSYRATAGLGTAPSFLSTTLIPGVLHRDTRQAQQLYQQLVSETAERPRPGSG